jgi:branched-chain amino acid transport system substrate-binding protein
MSGIKSMAGGRIVGVLTCGMLAASTLAACGGESAGDGVEDGEILVGVPAPLTGPAAAWGQNQVDGAQAVADAINESGGIKELDGAKLKLVVRDTKSDPVEAGKIVRGLASEGVVAIVGPVSSSEVLTVKPLLQSLKIPAFTGSTDSRVTEDNVNGYIFRTQLSIAQSVPETVEFVKSAAEEGTLPEVSKVGVVSTSTPPGSSATPQLMELIESELGAEPTLYEYDPTQIKDFAPTVAKMRQDGVELIMGYQNPVDADLFAKAVAAQSWRPAAFVFTSSPPYQDAFREAAGSAVEGWVSSAYSPAAMDIDYFSDELRDVAKAFESSHDHTFAGSTASVGANNVAVLANAIAAAASADPADITEAARGLDFSDPTSAPYPYMTTVGGLQFNEDQENPTLVVPIVQGTADAAAATIWPAEVATDEYQPLK